MKEIKFLSDLSNDEIRFAMDEDLNLYVWNGEFLHDYVLDKLKTNIYLDGTYYYGEWLINLAYLDKKMGRDNYNKNAYMFYFMKSKDVKRLNIKPEKVIFDYT